MRKIALYGKGGIGKSTTCANLCAALSKMDKRILQIGCDPKHDSCRTIMGEFIPTVLDVWREKSAIGEEIEESDILFTGFNGVSTIEAGGPLPGVGCAGRGVVKTMEILNELEIINDDYDYIFFDVLGDVVCGGFAKPIQVGYAEEIYIVTSGEFMSLYAANNIAIAIKNVSTECNVRLAGIILNSRNVQDEFELVDEFCKLINTRIIHNIPRDNEIGKYERNCKTVIEGNIDSNIAGEYFKLADAVEKNTEGRVPIPLTFDELRKLCETYGE